MLQGHKSLTLKDLPCYLMSTDNLVNDILMWFTETTSLSKKTNKPPQRQQAHGRAPQCLEQRECPVSGSE